MHAGSGATPAPEEPAGRVETPAMAEKYESYFRLHKRFSSDGDRLSHVEVEMLRREPSGRKGLIVQDPGKRKTFDSEASAYEWMDLCLSARPAPLAALKPAPVRGAPPAVPWQILFARCGRMISWARCSGSHRRQNAMRSSMAVSDGLSCLCA